MLTQEKAAAAKKARPRRRQWAATLSGVVFVAAIIYCACTLSIHSPEATAATGASRVPNGYAAHQASNDVDEKPQVEDDSFTLHPEKHIFRKAQTIHLSWNVTKEQRAPDGVSKPVYLVNGQFPGPLIEARSGDELVVDVHNAVVGDDQGISVHWHGLLMKGANEMDGAVGLTQCDIPPSRNFTYRFRIDEQQSGTFWYHAHSGVQRADGLFGGLVVHRPAASASDQYEAEKLLLVGDWYHRPAGEVLDWFKDPSHNAYEPAPDSLLINGQGHFNCSMAVRARPVDCHSVETPALTLPARDRLRLRVVNTGISTGFTMALSQGSMRVITVDGDNAVASDTPAAASVGVLYPGERTDVILERRASVKGQGPGEVEPQLTISLDRENMRLQNFALTQTQSFPLVWRGGGSHNPRASPAQAVERLALADLSGAPLSPAILSAVQHPAETAVLYTTMQVRAASHNQPVGTVNHTSWTGTEAGRRPLLALDRAEWPAAASQPTPAQRLDVPWFRNASAERWIELVLNNLDGTGHPIHLHGYRFFVVSKQSVRPGQPAGFNPFDPAAAARAGPVDTASPLRKDTVYVPPMGYVRLRFALDNPGLWLLHCHVLWHQAVGMGIVVQVGDVAPEARRQASSLCPK